MTRSSRSSDAFSSPELSDTELTALLTAYRPTGIDAVLWRTVAEDAINLVLKAGRPTRGRVMFDLKVLADVMAHLSARGRPVNVTEAVADSTLLSYDTASNGDPTAQATRRSVLRRLQAAHRELPWRADRRADGVRVETLVPHSEVAVMRRVLRAAGAASAADDNAAAFVRSISSAREFRRTDESTPHMDQPTWRRARKWAAQYGWIPTRPLLRAVVTHEVLDRAVPVAVLVAQFALTRRDLDLALSQAQDLPETPGGAHHRLLRGPLQA